MKCVETDGFRFEFENALEAFKFDDEDKMSSHYHGVTVLKAVDIIAEFDSCTFFIELKEYRLWEINELVQNLQDRNQEKASANVIIKSLVQKFRDTLLYRSAENKIEKPVNYVCLMPNGNPAVNKAIEEELNIQIPVGKAPGAWKRLQNIGRAPKWKKALLEECVVGDIDLIEHKYPNWTISRL